MHSVTIEKEENESTLRICLNKFYHVILPTLYPEYVSVLTYRSTYIKNRLRWCTQAQKYNNNKEVLNWAYQLVT